MGNFEWRISIADVGAEGPFSRFQNVDRILTVLEGRLELHFVEDGRTVTLDPGRPFAFPGDVGIDGTPVGGPVRDLNVMVRRGGWRARVDRWRPGLEARGVRIALANRPSLTLARYDAVLIDSDNVLPHGFAGFLIRLDPPA